MRKPAAYLFAILIGAIIWFFFQHFKIEGTNLLRVVPKSEQELNRVAEADAEQATNKPFIRLPDLLPGRKQPQQVNNTETATDEATDPATVKSTHVQSGTSSPDTIRVASFHLTFFGSSVDDPQSINNLAKVVRLFDVIALQGISPQGTAAVNQLARLAGENYEAIFSKSVSAHIQDEEFAYIFNRNTIIADYGDGLYALIDHDNVLTRDPLVGWFRAKEAPAEDAFTFSLVNVSVDAARAAQELDVLDNAMFVIRNDQREEDDVIMLGCFQAAANQMRQLGSVRGFVATIRDVPTDLRRSSQTQNIVFQLPETDEWTGTAKVFDFLRAFNLNSDEAALISDYLPVWAEFSIFEGGKQGRIANRQGNHF